MAKSFLSALRAFVDNTATAWGRSHPCTFASIFVGYLHWDLCWVLWHQRASPDLGSIVHHVRRGQSCTGMSSRLQEFYADPVALQLHSRFFFVDI